VPRSVARTDDLPLATADDSRVSQRQRKARCHAQHRPPSRPRDADPFRECSCTPSMAICCEQVGSQASKSSTGATERDDSPPPQWRLAARTGPLLGRRAGQSARLCALSACRP
jgi:hypothetical protein